MRSDGDAVKRSDCILVYGSTNKGDVVKRSDCILLNGSTTKGGVVKRSDWILVYGSTTKGDVVKSTRCDCSGLNSSVYQILCLHKEPLNAYSYVLCLTRNIVL